MLNFTLERIERIKKMYVEFDKAKADKNYKLYNELKKEIEIQLCYLKLEKGAK